MNVATLARPLARVSPPLTNAPGISTLTSDKATIANDDTEVATFTVRCLDKDGNPVAGEYVAASATGTGNTVSSPAQTDSNGESTFTVKSSVAATKVVSARVRNIPVTQTVNLVVSSASVIDVTTSTVVLSPATAVEGDSPVLVTLQGKDSGGNNMTTGGSTIVFASNDTNIATVGSTTDVGDGTYTALVTPVAQGSATISATIDSNPVTDTDTFTVTDSATFSAGDILDNFGFESASWGYFRNGSAGTPSGGTLTLDTSPPVAMTGTYSAKRVLPVSNPTNDDSPACYLPFGRPTTSPWNMMSNPGNQGGNHGVDRLWSRFDFVYDGAMSAGAVLKMQIYESYSFGSQYGGLYVHSGKFAWFFIENVYTLGYSTLKTAAQVCDGAKHTVEIDYWLNGDTGYDGTDRPSVQIWLDGVALTPADKTASSSPYSTTNTLSNGRIYCVATGFPNAGGTRRYPTSDQIGSWNVHGILNHASNTVQRNMWVDRISVSTTGRVGP